jgi:ABC-2 type transport system ATP-binding protein
VTKRYGEVVALDDVSLTVAVGTVHGLVGPNGAGKSTLLRLLLGLARPDRGEVRLFGHRVRGADLAQGLLPVAGFVDRPRFWPYLSARRTLEVLAAADGLVDAPAPDDVLEAVGLAPVAHRRVRGWSTGMVQRLGVAAALLRRPRLLVLDEPTEGLDPIGAADLLGLVDQLRAEGVAVLLSSHDMAEVDRHCDTVTVIAGGRVVREGSVEALRRDAPYGRHMLRTTDDDTAVALAAGRAVSLVANARGELLLEGSPAEVQAFICDLGRNDVAVVALQQEVAPLVALFHELTGVA